MEKVTKFFVDPPEGWKYGFPVIFDNTVETYEIFLRGHGYPEDMIPLALNHSRFWQLNAEEITWANGNGGKVENVR